VARASVELIVEAAKAVNPLRKVEQHSEKVDQALKKNQKSARNVEAAFQRMGRNGIRSFRDLESNAARLGKRMSGLRGTVGKAVVGFVAFKSVQTGIARLESERRIQLLGKRFGEVAGLQNAAAQAAKKFKLSQTEANQSLANAFARLRPLGVSLEDITSTFGGFRTAAVLGGATAAEASAAFTQLSQALGSGALRGDEFRSIAEQAPLVLQAISDETGIAAGKLKEYAAQGLLTSDIVIKALKRIESDGAESLAQALNGPAAKIKEFQNAVEDAQVAATESAIPAITDAISELGTVIRQLEPAIRFIGGLLAGVAKVVGNIVENIASGGKLAAATQAANAAATLQTNNKFGKPGLFGRPDEAKEFRAEVLKRELSRRLAIARGAMPGQLPASAADIASNVTGTSPITLPTKDSGGGGAGGAARERVDMSQELFDLNKRLLGQGDALTESERIVLNFQIEKQRIAEASLLPREEEIKLLEAAAGFEQDILDRREEQQKLTDEANKKAAEETKRQEEAAKRRLEADPGFQMQQQLEKLLETQNQVAFAATSMGSAFANAFGDVVTGAKTGQEALADMLKSIASDFLEMAKKIIAQQLAMILYGTIMKALGVSMPGGGGMGGQSYFDPKTGLGVAGPNFGFAEGGYVNKPTNALIGEGGEPEYVIPESKMRESMSRYSRGSRGNSVIPASGDGGTEGGGGGTAVAAPIDVRYTVERINSVDYVTADQFQSGMQSAAAQGAKRGEQNTLKRLQMSGSTRKRLGL
jgi:tape measure domain-containing protein